MRKALIAIVLFICGILEFMAFESPRDAVSNLSQWGKSLGLPIPVWLSNENVDLIVKCVGIIAISLCVLYFALSCLKSFRDRRKALGPNYPAPFYERKELIRTMMSLGATVQDGVFELKMGNKITTKEWFTTPVAFRVIAKTNSTNIRLSYAETEIVFNWEVHMALGILLIRGGPLKEVVEHRIGQVSVNEWVTIDLIYKRDSFTICVDGSQRFTRNADYSQCNHPLSIFTEAYATVHVRSILVGTPAPLLLN